MTIDLPSSIDILYTHGIVPVRVAAHDKNPIDKEWHTGNVTIDKDTLLKEVQEGLINLGVLCGKASGIIAVDIDTDNKSVIKIVENSLGKSPCIKVGERGCTYFYLHTDEYSHSIKTSKGNIDILASNPKTLAGKQTLIPPSIHPSGMVYKWIGDANCLDKSLLTPVSSAQWELLYAELGVNAPVINTSSPNPYITGAFKDVPDALETIKSMLKVCDPDCSYDEWRNIGYAVHYALDDTIGHKLFTAWSKQGTKYDAKAVATCADIFKPTPSYTGNQITISTLIAIARKNGYTPSNKLQASALAVMEYDRVKHKGNIPLEALFTGYNYSAHGFLGGLYSQESFVERIKQRYANYICVIDTGAEYKFMVYNELDSCWVEQTRKSSGVLARLLRLTIADYLSSPEFVKDCTNADGVYETKVADKIRKTIAGSSTFANTVINKCIQEVSDFTMYSLESFDSDRALFSCLSGVIDLRTGACRKRKLEDKILKIVPIEYDNKAPYDEWEALLREMFYYNDNPTEMIAYLKTLFGYFLTGEVTDDKIYVLHGTGGNGKSKVCDALLSVLGLGATTGYGTKQSSELFTERGIVGTTKELALVMGKSRSKRVCFASDMKDDAKWDSGVIKSLTERTFAGRILYENESSFNNTCKFIFNANTLPEFANLNHGITRRMALIPFRRSFTEEGIQSFTKVDDIIKRNLPGIFRWAVEGAIEYYANGQQIITPKECLASTDEYTDTSTSLPEAIRTILGTPSGRISLNDTDALQGYEWKKSSDVLPFILAHLHGLENYTRITPRALGKLLSQHNYRTKLTSSGRVYLVKYSVTTGVTPEHKSMDDAEMEQTKSEDDLDWDLH